MHAIFVLLLALMPQAPAAPPAEQPYKAIQISEPDVQEAVKALARRKAHADCAERHSSVEQPRQPVDGPAATVSLLAWCSRAMRRSGGR
jgi:hypothetical protein